MKPFVLPLFLLTFSHFSLPVWAQPAGKKSYDVKVSGNTRSQKRTVRHLTEKCVQQHEDDSSGEDLEADYLEQCLKNSKLFTEVHVKLENQTIFAEVEDVWTLIPIPVLSAGENFHSAGLVLSDSNFLGLGMEAAAGYAGSNRGDMYGFLIRDPSLFLTNWTYSVGAIRMIQDVVFKEGIETKDGFHETIKGGMLELGYTFQRLKVSTSLVAGEGKYDALRDYEAMPDNKSVRMGLALNYDRQDFKLYFSEGLALGFDISREIDRTDGEKLMLLYNLRGNYQKSFFTDQVLQLSVTTSHNVGGSKVDAIRVGGSTGSRGIEGGSVWVDRQYALSVEYQIPLREFDSGTLTFAPFADSGRLLPIAGTKDHVDYVAAGASLYFFLKDVAIPGVGVTAGYNDRYQKTFFTFALGLGV